MDSSSGNLTILLRTCFLLFGSFLHFTVCAYFLLGIMASAALGLWNVVIST